MDLNKTIQHYFRQPSLDSVSQSALEELVQQYPYVGSLQYLLLRKMKQNHAPGFNDQWRKTQLYFPDPYYLHSILTRKPFAPAETGLVSELKSELADALARAKSIAQATMNSETEPDEDEAALHHPLLDSEEELVEPAEPFQFRNSPARDPKAIAESQLTAGEELDQKAKTEDSDQKLKTEELEPKAMTTDDSEPKARPEDSELKATPDNSELRAAEPKSTDKAVADKPEESTRPLPGADTLPFEKRSGSPKSAGEADLRSDILSRESPIKIPSLRDLGPVTDDMPSFEPYHTIDYFASQGIKLNNEIPKDKFGKQLKSFTEWIRTMKKLPNTAIEEKLEGATGGEKIEAMAAVSIEGKEILTETMADVLIKQGHKERAAEIFRKLSLAHPDKSAYFASRIEQLNKVP